MNTATNSMATMRIPQKFMNFIKGNPLIAENVGKLIINRAELSEMIERINSVLDPDIFAGDLMYGTKEELAELLEFFKNSPNPLLFNNLTNDEVNEIKKTLSKSGPTVSSHLDSKSN